MRPRVFPAEDPVRDEPEAPEAPASMRPRVFPAEDKSTSPRENGGFIRFNEAAGIPRGRRHRDADDPGRRNGFNEAAGIPRGRLKSSGDRISASFELQ